MNRKLSVDELKYQKDHPDAIFCLEPTLTKQSFKEECDVNEILKRAANGEDLSARLNSRVAQYGDFTNIPDFRESMNLIARANRMFMELDWQLRERFANDPAKLIDFLQDPANREEAVKLGLVNAPAKPVDNGAGSPAPASGAGTAQPKDTKGPAAQ